MSGHYEARKGEYLISTDASLLRIELIHQFLAEHSYWARNIPREVVEKSVRNSLCFGLYAQEKQVGFARLVTDRATFAYLADVFILESYRGKGLAKWLLEIIQAHPELQNLRRWMLGTRDAHSLYAGLGWTKLDEETRNRFMQRHNKNVYS